MSRLRILVLGPDCNPECVSIPFVSYCHAAALAELHEVTLVVGSPSEEKVRRARAPFRAIEVVRMPRLDRIFAWCFRTILRSNWDSQWVTAFSYPFSVAFEWLAWRQLRQRIFAGEFDVVLRVLPMTAVLPSPFAFFLRKGPIPFVIGPLQGGLRSAPGFSQPDKKSFGLRKLYRFLPFARSTYRHAAAIIAASSQTYAEFAPYCDKLFFVPEPGIGRSQCYGDSRSPVDGQALQPDHAVIIDAVVAKIKALASTPFPVRFVLQTGDAVANGTNGAAWKGQDWHHAPIRPELGTFQISGWFDDDLPGTLAGFGAIPAGLARSIAASAAFGVTIPSIYTFNAGQACVAGSRILIQRQ
jgi:hypothetical protein